VNIETDDSRNADICKNCQTAFVTEKAIAACNSEHNRFSKIGRWINLRDQLNPMHIIIFIVMTAWLFIVPVFYVHSWRFGYHSGSGYSILFGSGRAHNFNLISTLLAFLTAMGSLIYIVLVTAVKKARKRFFAHVQIIFSAFGTISYALFSKNPSTMILVVFVTAAIFITYWSLFIYEKLNNTKQGKMAE